MDIDENLLKIQGALSSFSNSTSDNDRVEVLRPLFQNVKEQDKIKMTFFMILNTKMKVAKYLKEDMAVGLLTDICQNLDFPALSYIIFNLELVTCLTDIVSNCPVDVVVELLSGVFAYADSVISLRGLEKVIVAIYEKIEKIMRGIHNDCHLTNELWDFLNTFADMMWNPTTFGKDSTVEIDFNPLLEACLGILNLHRGKTSITVNPVFELDATPFIELNKDYVSNFNRNHVDKRCRLKKYFSKLLNLLNDSCNKPESEKLITKKMSENAFVLYEELRRSDVEPDNISYLDYIKRKPETDLEKMAKSDLKTIISKITNDKSSKNWFKALLCFPNAVKNEEAVICFTNHLGLADSRDLVTLINLVQAQFTTSSVVPERFHKLYFLCLSKMAMADQLLHLENYFSLDCRPVWDMSTIDEELTEAFNKISEKEGRDIAVKSSLIAFCIQSPIRTITKICKQALTSTAQLNTCVEDLKMLKAACVSRNFEPDNEQRLDVINSVMQVMVNDDDYNLMEKQFIVNLITRLQKEKILDKTIIENCVVRIIHMALRAMNYEKLMFALEILRSSVKVRTLNLNEFVMIAFMSQILNLATWGCNTFSVNRAKVREIIIGIIALLMRNSKFNASDDFSGAELTWLRKQITKSWRINQLYFCDLWYSYDVEFPVSDDLHIQLVMLLHTKIRVHSIIDSVITKFQSLKLPDLRISFAVAFIQILPLLTGKEWLSLFTHVKSIVTAWLALQVEKSDVDISLEILRIFTLSMYCLAQDMNQNKDTSPCFGYCVRNFGKIIQQNFLTCEDVKMEICVDLVKELLFLLNGIRNSRCRKENSIVLSPIIFEIGNRASAKNTLENESDNDNDNGNNENEIVNELRELELWFKHDFIERHPEELSLWMGLQRK